MQDLKVRTRNYSLRIIRLYESLGARRVARVLGDQMLRSGTSVGAHFRMREHSGIVPAKKLAALTDETDQLIAILVTLTKNAKRR